MTVREIDRRVLLVHVAVEVGLITCVWGRIGQAAEVQGFCLLPPNEVEDAEGLGTEHVGEDVEGNGQKERSTRDMANEMEVIAEKCTTQIPLTLSHCGVPTLEKGSAV